MSDFWHVLSMLTNVMATISLIYLVGLIGIENFTDKNIKNGFFWFGFMITLSLFMLSVFCSIIDNNFYGDFFKMGNSLYIVLGWLFGVIAPATLICVVLIQLFYNNNPLAQERYTMIGIPLAFIAFLLSVSCFTIENYLNKSIEISYYSKVLKQDKILNELTYQNLKINNFDLKKSNCSEEQGCSYTVKNNPICVALFTQIKNQKYKYFNDVLNFNYISNAYLLNNNDLIKEMAESITISAQKQINLNK